MLPFTSCGSLSRALYSKYFENKALDSTALHASKDFAVSPDMFPYRLFPKESACFRLRRLCSHLYVITDTTGVTRYPAPCCHGRVRTFLPTEVRRSSCSSIITQNYRVGNTTRSPSLMPFFSTKPAVVSTTYRASLFGTNIAG